MGRVFRILLLLLLAACLVAAVFPHQLGIERSEWVPQNMLGHLALQLTDDPDDLGDSYIAVDVPESGECADQWLNVTDWVPPADPALFLTSRRVLGWACAGQGDDARAAGYFLEAARYRRAHGLTHDIYEIFDWRAGVRFTWRAQGQIAAEEIAAEAVQAIEASLVLLDLAIETGEVEVEYIDAEVGADWTPDLYDWRNASDAAAIYIEMTRLALLDGLAGDADRYLDLAISLRPFGWPEPDRAALTDYLVTRS